MHNIQLTLTKQTYKLDDGNLCTGVQVIICPMVYKFISLSKQKLDLLQELRPDFYQWFVNAADGQSLTIGEGLASLPNSIPHTDPTPDNFLA